MTLWIVTDGDGGLTAAFTEKEKLIEWYKNNDISISNEVYTCTENTDQMESIGEFGEIRFFDGLHKERD